MKLPRVKGEVIFDHVDFSYTENAVLHDVNLRIEPGQLVALVGTDGQRQDHDCLAALPLLRCHRWAHHDRWL